MAGLLGPVRITEDEMPLTVDRHILLQFKGCCPRWPHPLCAKFATRVAQSHSILR
jgi:hypothetical protein